MAKKVVLIIGALSVLLVLVLSYHTKPPSPPNETVRVGAILPLSGELSFFGEHLQRGMRVALDELTSRNKLYIELSYNRTDNVRTINALHALLARKIDLLLPTESSTIAAVNSIIESEGLPAFIIFDSNEFLTTLSPYIFGFGFSNENTGAHMASFSFQELGVKRIGIISLNDRWSQMIARGFEDQHLALGGEVLFHEKVDLDFTDFRTLVLRAKEAEVEALYFPLFGRPEITLIEQARELGFDGHLLTAEGLTLFDIAEHPNLFEGIYSTQPWITNPGFLEQYTSAYGSEHNIAVGIAALGYDSVMYANTLAEQSLGSPEPFSRDLLLRNARSTLYQGITGRVDFSESNLSQKVEPITVIKNGVFEIVDHTPSHPNHTNLR